MHVKHAVTLEVQDPEQARLLLEDAVRRVLAPFVGRERRASEVARELGMPLNTLLYQLRPLLNAGLLEVAREEARAGRALRLYQATAEEFHIPYALTPAETPQALLEAEHASLNRLLAQGLARAGEAALDARGERVWGVRAALEGEVLVLKNAIGPESTWNFLDPDAPALVDLWAQDLTLEFADAKALQAELCALFERHRGRGGGQRYVLRLGLAPLE